MENKNKKKEQFSLKEYETDVSGVSLNKLETGLWWMKNRSLLKKILIIILIISILMGWVYSIYNLGNYFINGMNQDDKMLRELVNTKVGDLNFFEIRSAEDLVISSVGSFGGSLGSDFYAIVKNPNEKYWGSFSYCFIRSSEEISCGENFILPSEKKYILSLNREDVYSASVLKFVIKEISWKRINSHEIYNWTEYSAERLNIKISGIMISNEGDDNEYLSFSIKNDTSYSFWELPLKIAIEKYGEVTAVNSYILSNFRSNEERQVKIKWPDNSDLSGSISIIPDVNILNENVYMNPER